MSKKLIKIINASAGSGKTYRLTSEFIKRVMEEPKSLKNTLSITFTNKASNEMRERIIKNLKGIYLDKSSIEIRNLKKEILSTIKLRKEKEATELLRKKALEVLINIVENYSDFHVKTIDSLMVDVLKSILTELELPYDLNIGVSIDRELKKIFLLFIEDYILNNEEEFIKLLQYSISLQNFEGWRIEEHIFDKIIKPQFKITLSSGTYDNENEKVNSEENPLKSFNSYFKQLIEALKNFRNYTNGKYIKEKTLENLSNLSLENSGEKKYIDDVLNFTVIKNNYREEIFKKGTPDKVKDLTIEKIKAVFENLPSLLNYFSEKHYSVFTEFYRKFSCYWFSRFNQIDDSPLFVSELPLVLKNKFKEWEEYGVPFLYFKMAERFYNFLFDEFQDTSKLQFEALKPLISESLQTNTESASLTVVGDKKQAIYRWRGGEAELLNQEVLIDNLECQNLKEYVEEEILSVNYRSSKKIVEFANNFFLEDNLKELISSSEHDEIKNKIIETFKNSQQKAVKMSDGYVKVLFYKYDEGKNKDEYKSEFYNKTILPIVKDLTENKKILPSWIAILVRKNDEEREIIKTLSQAGISASGENSLQLSNSLHIQEIISFMRFIEYPPDNLSFISFVCGEIFNKISEDKIDTKFFEKRGDKKAYIYFRENKPELWKKYIEPFFKKAGTLPPYDLLHDIIKEFKILTNFKSSSKFIIKLLDTLYTLEKDGITTLSSFLNYWDENSENSDEFTIEASEDESKVRVLTIHKAKGLEFPVVILPLLETKQKNKNLFFKDGKFFYIKKAYTKASEFLKAIYKEHWMKKYIDELNTLYVAITRAKDALFIPIAVEEKIEKNKIDPQNLEFSGIWELFLRNPFVAEKNFNDFEYGKLKLKNIKEDRREKEGTIEATEKLIPTINWQREHIVFSSKEIEDKDETERGTIIHKLLEKIELVSSLDELLKKIDELSIRLSIGKEDVNTIKKFFKSNWKKVSKFYTGKIKVLNEFEIVKSYTNEFKRKRIDRLVGFENFIKTSIIDYKTGEENTEKYKEQMLEYIDGIKKIFNPDNIECYLYYIDKNKIKKIQ